MKKMIKLTALILFVGVVGLSINPQPEIHAQSVYQAIPQKFRGTWRLKKASYRVRHEKVKLHVTSRSIKASVIKLKGKQLGVKHGKNWVHIFQISKGKQSGEAYSMQRIHFKGRTALKIRYDTVIEYYVR